MAVNATMIKGPYYIGAGIKEAIYTVALDTAFASAGEPIDFTTEANGSFSEIYWAAVGGSDAQADNNVTYGFDLTAKGTDIAAGTVLLTCYVCTTAGQRYGAYTGDLTSVGELRICVKGR
jgi:hypothetical protein